MSDKLEAGRHGAQRSRKSKILGCDVVAAASSV